MKKILLIGAGRSSSSLIAYLLKYAETEKWILRVADLSLESAAAKLENHPSGEALELDIRNHTALIEEIAKADLVLSMLPAHMHISVAKECVRLKKHLVTASYVSQEMSDLDAEAKNAGIILLNECGLDPGIDHMSAMEVIDRIQDEGGRITSFKSYTGGLVAPESNDNPWGYKFSWNPRNVILAGQGTARFIQDNRYKYIPYHRLFSQIEKIFVQDHGTFDGYANRDSLSYRKLYRLENIQTMLRGTLRQEGFCKAWNIFVQLGLTDDSYKITGSSGLTYAGLIDSFLPASSEKKSIRQRLAEFVSLDERDSALEMISWTGILDETLIGISEGSPAMILQDLLEKKWVLRDTDKDMIVMQHLFSYELNKKQFELSSSLVVKGENSIYTAMAKTVGLPAAIATRLILNGTITRRGVRIPVEKELYVPILKELENYGVNFVHHLKEQS
ncbi:MAG: saccharopine dehydrogenase NADP-binding domain-containing protein [Bacteroidia bacterium]|nr:saccharopine dehydrogenase NADP-binding domain-containing protein [Bacteroidia bacterium]